MCGSWTAKRTDDCIDDLEEEHERFLQHATNGVGNQTRHVRDLPQAGPAQQSECDAGTLAQGARGRR